MSRWRFVVLLTLFFGPFVFMMGVGAYHLWITGWTFYAWWPMAICFALCYLLAWYWQKKKALLPLWNVEKIPHGSARDQEAWKLVEQRAHQAENLPSEKFTDPDFYLQTAQEMARDMARFYRPGTQDYYSMLTVPEMLSVAELAAHDLNEMVQRYVPGSHLMTVRDYQHARLAVDWYRRANNVYWLVSAVFNPLKTAARFFAARVATGGTWDLLQQNVLVWFYTAFVHRMGTYLIELHSGRLRVGVKRYRELMAEHRLDGGPEEPAEPDEEPPAARDVTITLAGQVKAGKSSLINALLGERRAETDILPLTNEITRYLLKPANIDSQLALLDTVGYGREGPSEDQLKSTEEAARHSDLLFLVLHARNPARLADEQMLKRLTEWFATQPNLRMPPVVGVVTHIDLLTPAMEWAPPYDWLHPTRTKEQQIRDALRVVHDQFGGRLAAVVPVCTSAGKVLGIDEWLLPAVVERLGEARSVALLRCLKAEADKNKIRRVFSQLIELGREAAKVLWAGAPK
jgi:predicted GTPase